MELFVSDLDNTLIYSYKRDIGEEKRLVETMRGKELSFMTETSHRLLKVATEQYCFVPATTRSLEQYGRICFFPDWAPEYALTSNGGNLLRCGRVDTRWYEESRSLCAAAEYSLSEAERLLMNDAQVSFEVRRVDGLFVFTKSEDVDQTVALLRQYLDLDTVEVLNHGSKVYVMPHGLSKGAAVRRLRSLVGAEWIAVAGDSEFDVSMLLEADEAWFPEELDRGRLKAHLGKHVVPKEELFSDRLLLDLSCTGAR